MEIRLYESVDELDPIVPLWRQLAAGSPLVGPEWLLTWWRHYGAGRRLWIVGVWDGPRLVGLAPWFVQRTWLGSTVRVLGSGEVCTDYLSVLLDPEVSGKVVAALADWLIDRRAWSHLNLDAVDAMDPAIDGLVHELKQRGALAWTRPAVNTWRLELPESWDAYLAGLSKSHRKFIRRLDKNVLETQRATWYTAGENCEFDRAWDVLVDLHQRRRRSLGEPCCFTSKTYAAFHRDAAQALLNHGQLRLHWLQLDGRPIAAEYHLAGDGIVYGYQSGLDPDRLDEEPGRLAFICVLKSALASGYKAIDLMRGDEPYKAHWRATPRPQLQVDLLPPRFPSRVRLQAWKAKATLRRLLKPTPSAPQPETTPQAEPAEPVAV